MKFINIALFNLAKYLLAFLLIFITSVAIYSASENNFEDYILERFHLQVQEGINILNESINKIDQLSEMIYNSNDFTQLTRHKENLSPQNFLQLRSSQDLMAHIHAISNSSSYYFVLFRT